MNVSIFNGASANYIMVSRIQWKPFWLATQRDPPNDWTGWQICVNCDIFAQVPLSGLESGCTRHMAKLKPQVGRQGSKNLFSITRQGGSKQKVLGAKVAVKLKFQSPN